MTRTPFEEIVAEFLELEPLDYGQLSVFYKKYEGFLRTFEPENKSDKEYYNMILEDIGVTYALANEYEIAVPLFRKIIKHGGKEVNTARFWMGIYYFGSNKFLRAFISFLRGEKKWQQGEHYEFVFKISKVKAIKKVLGILAVVGIVVFLSKRLIIWMYPELMSMNAAIIGSAGAFLPFVYSIYWWYSDNYIKKVTEEYK